MRVVPNRGSSLFSVAGEISSLSGRAGVFRTELARLVNTGCLGGELLGGMKAGLTWSVSGGGVGGNMLRLIGGADCCRPLLCRSGLTRFEAANDMFSGGRSSMLASSALILAFAMASAFASEPAKPVEVFP